VYCAISKADTEEEEKNGVLLGGAVYVRRILTSE
jgi:hypothetical protein